MGAQEPQPKTETGWETSFCKESELGTNSISPNSQAWIEMQVRVPFLLRPWGLCIRGEVPKGLCEDREAPKGSVRTGRPGEEEEVG